MSQLVKNTAVFSALTLISRLTGLLRVMMFAMILGRSRLNDAFQLANTIPNIIYEAMLGGLLSAIFIPILVHEQEKSGKSSAEAWRVANLLVGYVGVVLALVSLAAAVFSPQIIGSMTWLARGNQAVESKELAEVFLRYFAWQMIFYGLNSIFMAILNSHDVFAITAGAPILNNIVVIAALFGYRIGWIGDDGLAFAATLGVAVMALVQVPWLLKAGMPIRPRFNIFDPLFVIVPKLAAPMLPVSIANLVATVVRTNLLYTVAGAFVTYTFCFQLIMMPYGIFAVSLATVLYPALSRYAADSDWDGFRVYMSRGFRSTVFIMLPIALGMSLLAEPISRVLFERGEFTYTDSIFTARFLSLYALSILPYSLVIFATRVFYSMKDTVTPAWINIIGVAVNIGLNFLLMRFMGVPGIALSSTLTYTATTIISFVMIHHKLGSLDGRRMGVSFGKMALASAAMTVLLIAAQYLTQPHIMVLAKGTRALLRLPQDAAAGTAVVINEETGWKEFWRLIDHSALPPPSVNFRHESAVAIFGPRGQTTTTLDVRSWARDDTGVAAFQVDVHRRPARARTTATLSLPMNPSYLVAVVRPPVSGARPEFHIAKAVSRSSLMRALQAPEALRLAVLVIVGAVVYLAAVFFLRAEELCSLGALLRRQPPRQPDTTTEGTA
ncbi:MAG: murein biosynthesis integral membrane protein MurJ [bacterium]